MEKKLSLSVTFFRYITQTIPLTPLHCILSINEYHVEAPLHSVLSAQARAFISAEALQHPALKQVFGQTRFRELSPEDREYIKTYLSRSEYPRLRHPHYRKPLPQVSALRKRGGRRRSPRRSEYAREARIAPSLTLIREDLALNL